MELDDLARTIPNFTSLSSTEKVKAFQGAGVHHNPTPGPAG